MQGSGSFARGFGVVPVQIIAALSSKVGIELIHMESPNQSRSPTTPDQSSQIAPLQFASAPVQPVGLAATQLMKVRTIEISLDALDRVFAELIAAGRDDGLAMARTRP